MPNMEQSRPEVPLTAAYVVDRIFDASTLEDAIFWRQEMVDRLAHAIANSAGILTDEERGVYELAKAQTEEAIKRLRVCFENDDRPMWKSR